MVDLVKLVRLSSIVTLKANLKAFFSKLPLIYIFVLFSFYGFSQQANLEFGTEGTVITDVGNQSDSFGEMIVLDNGQILQFGFSGVFFNSTDFGFTVVKYNEDGSIDNSFGIKGKTILNFDSYQSSFPTSAVVQEDGKIVIAGTTGAYFVRGVITRLLPNGDIDSEFGFNGKMELESTLVNKLLLTPDQKLLILGQTADKFSVERLGNDGFYDSTYGTNGVVILDNNGTDQRFVTGELLADGSIICFGDYVATDQTGTKSIFTKFSSTGTFDQGFGIKTINLPNILSQLNFNRHIADFKILSDNTIILLVNGSFLNFSSQQSADSRLYKVDMNGNLVTTFGTNGFYQFTRCFSCEEVGTSLQFTDNQNILVTTRYEYSGPLISVTNSLNTYLFNSNGLLNQNFGTAGKILVQHPYYLPPRVKTKLFMNKLYIGYSKDSDYHITSFLINDQLLSNADFQTNHLDAVIYPNPFSNRINIALKNNNSDDLTVSIFGMSGIEIFRRKYSNINHLAIDDVVNFQSGVYFLKIQSMNDSQIFKIIKK